jgi:hypothetical protein
MILRFDRKDEEIINKKKKTTLPENENIEKIKEKLLKYINEKAIEIE